MYGLGVPPINQKDNSLEVKEITPEPEEIFEVINVMGFNGWVLVDKKESISINGGNTFTCILARNKNSKSSYDVITEYHEMSGNRINPFQGSGIR